jgi:hypothetical protein
MATTTKGAAAMTKINFKHDGFGFHTAKVGEHIYSIAPLSYDNSGKPKYGYTAVRITHATPDRKHGFADIARGSFAACRAACKIDAQNIAQEIAA